MLSGDSNSHDNCPHAFCAGIDTRLLTPEGVPGEDPLPDMTAPGFEEWIASIQEGFTWLRRPDFVTIAAVQGHAIGGGFQLALSCDMRILADDARLCMKELMLIFVTDLAGANPKNLLLAVGGAAAIVATGVGGAQQATAYLIFALTGTLGVAAPVVIYFAMGDRSQEVLAKLSDWMSRNNAVIMSIICLIIGVKLIGDAISGLTG